ncbi:MAG: hypothetical protein ACYCO5_09010 [Acidobacteriaceae bacterium]
MKSVSSLSRLPPGRMEAVSRCDRANDVLTMLAQAGGQVRTFVAGFEIDIDRMMEGPSRLPIEFLASDDGPQANSMAIGHAVLPAGDVIVDEA